ncbi:phage portal protein [Rhodothalassium salexigens]|uniref:phage portal protein n=1 Tax=Rhodothalassium salexigens TaxID=1086 RepID=UPI0019144852|nr:phage portal protein [Rhodothalassium salexigens]MBK5910120.1 phage portal protein [Rhodothalassium salexigens]MBK5920733.1 phage portal protein [Rhodothalassium salexigens]
MRSGLMAAGYDAAGRGRRAAEWEPADLGPNALAAGDLALVRRRSRGALRRNSIADAAAEAFTDNLVGTGIRPQFKAPDEAFAAALSDWWQEWVECADADGVLDFYALQALVTRAWYEGGECFVRLRPRRLSDDLPAPLQIQVLESEMVPLDKHDGGAAGHMVRHGVEFDAIGRRVAYHVYRHHPHEIDAMGAGRADGADWGQTVRVPASEILHVYLPRRPGDVRGEPRLTRALVKLRDLDDYDDAELVRKKNAAMFVGVIRRALDGGGVPAVGAPIDEGDAGMAGDETEERAIEPGTFTVLEDGQDITFSKPEDVGGQYEVFMRTQLRLIAQAGGVLYEQLTGDYGQINDRTYRAALNGLIRKVERLQAHVLVAQFCRPVWWRLWAARPLDLAVPAGLSERQARAVAWRPHAFRYLHPVQEVDAAVKEIAAGLASREQKIAERGGDIREVDAARRGDRSRNEE